MKFVRHTLAHLKKDLRLEWRSRDSVTGMLFFALLVVVVFSLAFDPTAAMSRQIAGGVIWIVILFAATTTVNQSWTREQRNHVMDAHRMAPSSAAALFLGKAMANFLFVTAVEVVLAPLFTVFYNLRPLGQGWLLLLVLPLGNWALVANGTFFAAMSLRTRSRETMLPLVLFPISLPALLAMVQATSNILLGDNEPDFWIKLLVGYDVVFTTACVMLFDIVLNAE